MLIGEDGWQVADHTAARGNTEAHRNTVQHVPASLLCDLAYSSMSDKEVLLLQPTERSLITWSEILFSSATA